MVPISIFRNGGPCLFCKGSFSPRSSQHPLSDLSMKILVANRAQCLSQIGPNLVSRETNTRPQSETGLLQTGICFPIFNVHCTLQVTVFREKRLFQNLSKFLYFLSIAGIGAALQVSNSLIFKGQHFAMEQKKIVLIFILLIIAQQSKGKEQTYQSSDIWLGVLK